MKAGSVMLMAAAVAVSLAPVAASATEATGRIASVTGHSYVARNGRLLRAVPSMRLVKGDRIVTRADGTATALLADGCNLAVGASTSAGVASCAPTEAIGLGDTADTARRASSRGGLNGGTLAVAIGAVAAAALGIAAAAGSGASPNSP